MLLGVILVVPFLAAAFIGWLLSLKRWERRLAFYALSGAYYFLLARAGSIEFQGRTLDYSGEPWMQALGCLSLGLAVVAIAYRHSSLGRARAAHR